MLGETEFLRISVLAIAAIAATTDFFYKKIYNWLTLPAILLGLVTSFYFHGWSGLLHSFLGVLVALLVYGWMYAIRVMGAGDVKLLMAMGALGGVAFTLDIAVLGVFVGGVMALVILTLKGRIQAFVKKMYRFLLTIVDKNLVLEFPKVDHQLTMPFGIAIAVAAAWVILDNPMLRWGIRLWS